MSRCPYAPSCPRCYLLAGHAGPCIFHVPSIPKEQLPEVDRWLPLEGEGRPSVRPVIAAADDTPERRLRALVVATLDGWDHRHFPRMERGFDDLRQLLLVATIDDDGEP